MLNGYVRFTPINNLYKCSCVLLFELKSHSIYLYMCMYACKCVFATIPYQTIPNYKSYRLAFRWFCLENFIHTECYLYVTIKKSSRAFTIAILQISSTLSLRALFDIKLVAVGLRWVAFIIADDIDKCKQEKYLYVWHFFYIELWLKQLKRQTLQ